MNQNETARFTELFSAALNAKSDVFIYRFSLPAADDIINICNGVKTAVVLPAKLYPSVNESISVFSLNDKYDFSANLIFFEARLFSVPEFRSSLICSDVQRIIVPFAELADDCEYGSLSGYSAIGEFRSQSLKYIQLIAFFSDGKGLQDFGYMYCSRQRIDFSPETRLTDFRVLPCRDTQERNGLILRQMKKSACNTCLVFFNTRTQCGEFRDYCRGKGIDFPVITGETPGTEIRRAAGLFKTSRCRFIVGTKSMLALFPLIRADNIIVAGIPYSKGHLRRMLSLGDKGAVIYSEDDKTKALDNIKDYCFNYRADIAQQLYDDKTAMLEEVLLLLDDE